MFAGVVQSMCLSTRKPRLNQEPKQVDEVRVHAAELGMAAKVLEELLAHPHQRRGAARRQVQAADQLLPPRLRGGVQRLDRLDAGVLAAAALRSRHRRRPGRGRSDRRASGGRRAAPRSRPRRRRRAASARGRRPRLRRAATGAGRRGPRGPGAATGPGCSRRRSSARPRSVSVSSRSPRKADRLSRGASGDFLTGISLGSDRAAAACREAHPGSTTKSSQTTTGATTVTMAP